MRRSVLIAALVLLVSAGAVSAQTVTPVASQLLPCAAGRGVVGQCGGLCAVGYQCVYVPANNDCSCQVDALACRGGVRGTEGYCPFQPNQVGGNCAPRGANTFNCE